MKALILAGGYGTRLRPLTVHVPKPLVQFCNIAIIEHQIKALAKFGVTDIILATSVVSDALVTELQSVSSRENVRLIFSKEKQQLGTAGPIKLAEKYLISSDVEKSNFIVLNSDIICNFPFNELLQSHISHNAQVTILTTKVENPSQFGVIVQKNGLVEKFVEKPIDFISNEINAGIYILSTEILDDIPLMNCSIEYDIFPKLVLKKKLYCIYSTVFWADVGKPSTYLSGTAAYLKYISENHLNSVNSSDCYLLDTHYTTGNVFVHKTSVIGKKCQLGPNVVLGENVLLKNNCKLSNCVIMRNSTLGYNVVIDSAIVGEKTNVGNNSCIDSMTVVAENVIIDRNCHLTNCKVFPNVKITSSISGTTCNPTKSSSTPCFAFISNVCARSCT